MKLCVVPFMMPVVRPAFPLSPEQEDGRVGSYGLNGKNGVESCSTRARAFRR